MFEASIDLPIDEIIADVAKKQKVIISKDDPIFTAVYLNQYVVNQLLEKVNANSEKFVDAITHELNVFSDSQKFLMQSQLEEYAPLLQKTLNEVAEREVVAFGQLMENQLAEYKASQKRQIRTQKRLSIISILACMVSITSLCGVILVLGN